MVWCWPFLFVLYEEQHGTISQFFCSLISRFLSSLFSSGRTCPWPLPPGENSVARLLSPTQSFSALLEVRCKPGFTLPSGLDVTIRRCQGDRQWSGDEPICTGGFEFSRKKKMLFFLAFSWFLHNQESRQQLIHTWKNAAAVFVTFSNGTLS